MRLESAILSAMRIIAYLFIFFCLFMALRYVGNNARTLDDIFPLLRQYIWDSIWIVLEPVLLTAFCLFAGIMIFNLASGIMSEPETTYYDLFPDAVPYSESSEPKTDVNPLPEPKQEPINESRGEADMVLICIHNDNGGEFKHVKRYSKEWNDYVKSQRELEGQQVRKEVDRKLKEVFYK